MSKLAFLFLLVVVTVTSLYWLHDNVGILTYKYDTINGGRDAIDFKDVKLKTTSLAASMLRSTDVPLILEWNLFFRRSLFEDRKYLEKTCPFKCAYTNNHTLLEDAAVTIHHMGGVDADGQLRSTNESYVSLFLNNEPPPHRPKYLKSKPNFFDYTVTYRQDSDLPIYYDSFVPLTGPNDTDRWTDAEVDKAIKAKKNPALWMVSHCSTPSKRETYVTELKKYMPVYQVGGCSKIKCTKFKDCEKELIKTHYFYLAFENSVCIDYITEKFFRLRELIVPIVLDRRVFRGVHEKLLNYAIVASDYKSPQKLADYLKFLIDHPKEYRRSVYSSKLKPDNIAVIYRYFDWT